MITADEARKLYKESPILKMLLEDASNKITKATEKGETSIQYTIGDKVAADYIFQESKKAGFIVSSLEYNPSYNQYEDAFYSFTISW